MEITKTTVLQHQNLIQSVNFEPHYSLLPLKYGHGKDKKVVVEAFPELVDVN
ncbi:hypothetical protein [Flagellimonas algicola]|uniref:hypothetical protein n=1 Tax=Flagellimonas algicola TaxID=2583815 RepID=UPI0013873E1B|nr:hypothetical protein [Allomuricauda algicola]